MEWSESYNEDGTWSVGLTYLVFDDRVLGNKGSQGFPTPIPFSSGFVFKVYETTQTVEQVSGGITCLNRVTIGSIDR